MELTSTSLGACTDQEKLGSVPSGTAFAAFLGFSLLYALVATIPVAFIEPVSGSSGIPEVKLILNGASEIVFRSRATPEACVLSMQALRCLASQGLRL
jgi:H+/Cl- antiporter ClcA